MADSGISMKGKFNEIPQVVKYFICCNQLNRSTPLVVCLSPAKTSFLLTPSKQNKILVSTATTHLVKNGIAS
jgi:hypothetical protein